MKEVAARYTKEAKKINADRSANMTDSTVIYVLSGILLPTRHACRDSKSTRIPCRRSVNQAEYHVRPDAVLRIRRRHRQLGIHGTVRPEHGEFRFPPDQPIPAAGAERALDADHQPDVGRRKELPSACTRTNRSCIRAPPTTRSSASHFYTLTGRTSSRIRTRSTIRRTSPRGHLPKHAGGSQENQVQPVPAGHHHAEPHALP